MPAAIRQTYPQSSPTLGNECHFQLTGAPVDGVEFFLEYDGILYPRPLQSEPSGTVRLYPEASGRYVLHAYWREADGARGRAALPIVVAGPSPECEPRLASVDERTSLWVPTEWDRQTIASHERPVLKTLQRLVRPGHVVYDVGANVGLFSVLLARGIGGEGWLYAFEPNPVCVSYLRANLERARAARFTILPVAISDRRGSCAFTVNYATTLVGSSADSRPGVQKPGHLIEVEADSLDSIVTTWQLRPPDIIKVDIEGAERVAMSGMLQVITAHRPALLVELHGREAATAALAPLRALPYEYSVATSAERFRTVDELLGWMADACIQVIARPVERALK
jgi:FkbM family methyltransferase